MPPTLTVHTRHRAVDLDRLEIPAGLDVSVGDVPTVFHTSNLKAKGDAGRRRPRWP